jgi:MFS family permease
VRSGALSTLYPSLKDVRVRETASEGRWWRPAVSANVVYLGLTSMLTDVSSEMVNAVVPLFLTFQLGFSPFQLGLFNGMYQVLAAFTALIGGALADRYRRYKEVAGVGYGMSAATRIGLVAARSAWIPATSLLYADRAAKGLRTAPRDALISQSALPGRLGEAFGVHRAMDTAGALAGPILAFVLLSAVPGGYNEVFRASFWIALSGLAVLILLVQNRPARSHSLPQSSLSIRGAFGLLRLPAYRRLVLAGSALSVVTIADAMVYVAFQQRSSMTTRFFPLLYVGTALAYLVLALPMGRLADRIGPTRVFVGGQALLLIVDAMLLVSNPGPLSLVLLLGALGTYYAATDGILAVVATSILPDEQRASGLALLGGAMALAAFASSTVFGAIWQWEGPTFAVAIFLIGLILSLATALRLLGPQLRREGSRRRFQYDG